MQTMEVAESAQPVRVWLVTPPLTGVSHPKTAVLRLAARQGAIAVRVRKVDALGAMRVIARGVSEKLAAFHGDLRHKVRDEGWHCSAVEVTAEEMAELEGGGQAILRTGNAVAGGANSSGGPGPPPAPSSDTTSIETGSSASSHLILQEVKLERLRGEALARQVAAAAAEREAAAVAAAEARVAAAVAAAAEREATLREASIAVLMKLGLSRPAAEELLSSA